MEESGRWVQPNGSTGLKRLSPDEKDHYLSFVRRNKSRFKAVFRGTSVLPGFASNDPNDQGFNYDKLFFFGEKARQAIEKVGGTGSRNWINLDGATWESIETLLRELQQRVIPYIPQHFPEFSTISHASAEAIKGKYLRWNHTRRVQFRNVLIYMMHKVGQVIHNWVYDRSVLVSTSEDYLVALHYAADSVLKQVPKKFIIMEYWLPKDFAEIAVCHSDLSKFKGFLPKDWPCKEEKEVAVVGGLFPHSILRVDQYGPSGLERTIMNPHLISQLNNNPAYCLDGNARIPFDQDRFRDKLLLETNYGVVYWSWLRRIVNERL